MINSHRVQSWDSFAHVGQSRMIWRVIHNVKQLSIEGQIKSYVDVDDPFAQWLH